jgi:NTP pyrophosphatase (non-canonical NTP hydrolase)
MPDKLNSDSKTSIDDAKAYIKKFCEERDWDQFHSPKDVSIGLITEAAELLELFRFKSQEQIQELFEKPESREKIADELSDSFYFVLRFAQKYNFDLIAELKKKMAKNAARYPVEKSKGNNKKYNEL